MKTFHFHPASLLAGLAIGAGFLFLTSQTSTPTFPTARVEVGPHPRDMIQIQQGSPYTVPIGKRFTLTALGSVGGNATDATFKVNGVAEIITTGLPLTPLRIAEVPSGFTVPWGSVLEVSGSFGNGRAWGYLSER